MIPFHTLIFNKCMAEEAEQAGDQELRVAGERDRRPDEPPREQHEG